MELKDTDVSVKEAHKQYKVVGIVVFVCAILILSMRIGSYYLQLALIDSKMDEAWLELILDACFTVPLQVGMLVIVPVLLYKKLLGKSSKQILEFSNFKKTNPLIYLLSAIIGLLMPTVTVLLNYIWLIILTIFGFTPPSSSTVLPENFSIVFFLLSVFLTAVLPAICEEFVNRGGLLTAIRKTHSETDTIILIGIAFGLFHQYIGQTVYTAVFGGLMAYIVLKCGSIYPAMIVHFCNNFFSVYIESAEAYNWPLGSYYDKISELFMGNVGQLFVTYAMLFLILFALLRAIVALSKKSSDGNFVYVRESTPKYTDRAAYMGAIAVTVSSTVLSFIFYS